MRLSDIEEKIKVVVDRFTVLSEEIIKEEFTLPSVEQIKNPDILISAYGKVIYKSDRVKRILFEVKKVRLDIAEVLRQIKRKSPAEYRKYHSVIGTYLEELDSRIDMLSIENNDLERKIRYFSSIQYILSSSKLNQYQT